MLRALRTLSTVQTVCSRANNESIFRSLCASGTLNGLFSKFDIHCLALLNDRSFGAEDLVLSKSSNTVIKYALGVTIFYISGDR